MARLWSLQPGVDGHIEIVFLFDNQAAADAVIGKADPGSNCIMCKFGIAVDRFCN